MFDTLKLSIDVPTIRPELYYRGLAAWCKQNAVRKVLEVGSENGDSAKCMALHSHVTACDLKYPIYLPSPNIDFIHLQNADSCLSLAVAGFDFIFIDIDHSGEMERRLHQKLTKEYDGWAAYDDVLGFSGMKSFWDSIEHEKHLVPWHQQWGFGFVRYGK